MSLYTFSFVSVIAASHNIDDDMLMVEEAPSDMVATESAWAVEVLAEEPVFPQVCLPICYTLEECSLHKIYCRGFVFLKGIVWLLEG